MRRIVFLIILIFCLAESCFAQSVTVPVKAPAVLKQITAQKSAVPAAKSLPPVSAASIPPVQPQPVDFAKCSSYFKLDSQKLFYLTLASVNANRFKVDEIQSKSGYVLFTVAQRQFLASVISVDAQNSMLKITPCNNVYYFPIGIVQNMFKYVELNLNTPIEKLVIL